ncbi:IS256 family transposase [Streptomyces sp. NBC_00124]|uniref:IS256 family transposase n=1 Tax=Streptomyces sp. NBC_00124 TaxID=2975662 RepID=UPI0022560BE8|nr:IS256 family transposase [Streptomyces sp. NBC_00124]MCX5367312.1 IS256 family transposase [Streptomyces sp. NBC_00124]MCX5367544.1 IS256 family transposase [Streptomyces sp. NBC_00124]
MALSQSELMRLLESLRRSEGVEAIRVVCERILQELIEAEATDVIGAAPREHSESRTTWRNGHRDRLLTTQAGDLDLKIPKVRTGSFFPSLLERRRRIDRALFAVVMEAYVHGVSTRSVDDLVKALGADSGISKSEVSRICGELDEELTAFKERPLDHTVFPYVFLDATYCKARVNHRIASQAVVIATGISATGHREILGVMVGDSESKPFWTKFLRSLRARGLENVQLVISDSHSGLVAAIRTVFLGAAWQRCRVHFVRDVFSVIEKGSGEMVAATIRTIFAQTTAEQVRTQLDVVADMLGRQFPQVKKMLLDAAPDITAFADFPSAHWKKIWSTNPLERLNREIKRRADVVQVFPNPAALDRLAAAVLAELHDEWQVFDRRYLSEASTAELFTTQPTPPEPQITPQPESKQLP